VPERALARVSCSAVERNCALLRSRLTGGAELCAVVKAGGYGHGAAECARAALRGGATWIAVATAPEAMELRRAGIDARVLVMGALTERDLATALDADADIAVWTDEMLGRAATACGGRGAPARIHVKFDSGMGRLGTKDAHEVRALCDRAASDERLELAGVWTHFATADEPGDDYFPAQLEAFAALADEVRARHPGTLAHAANSAATLREPAAHFDLVRCGVAIYGLDPFQRDPDEQSLVPALSLHSYVAAVKLFEAGQSAGYGRRWTAAEPTWVGVLPIGYGDGWRRALTNNAEVLVRGRRYPLVGTVSMDNITVDLGPDTDVRIGDEAVLIGSQDEERILAEEVAARLGTINYEVTCGIGRRVRYLHEA
jgi:alanine racemase